MRFSLELTPTQLGVCLKAQVLGFPEYWLEIQPTAGCPMQIRQSREWSQLTGGALTEEVNNSAKVIMTLFQTLSGFDREAMESMHWEDSFGEEMPRLRYQVKTTLGHWDLEDYGEVRRLVRALAGQPYALFHLVGPQRRLVECKTEEAICS